MRLKHDDRKRQILNEAVRIYMDDGVEAVTITKVARNCKVNHSLILYYFGTADELRRCVKLEKE
jgi:AcrR family transcriptional regulator